MPTIQNVVFDPWISQGATGGPGFFTTIIESFGGYDKTFANWATARCKWDVGHVIYSTDKLAYVLAFFRARQGRAYGFLFRDPTDYYAGMTWSNNALVPAATPEILPVAGDGATTAFQLTKTYADVAVTVVRPIYRPIQNDFHSGASVAPVIYQKIAGVWTAIASASYSVNYTTGVVTFTTAPGAGVQIGWSGQFYVAVRFDTDDMSISLEAANVGEWQSIPIVEVRE